MLEKLFFSSLLLALCLTACTQNDKHTQKSVEDTLRISISREPTVLDVRSGTSLSTAVVLKMLYEGLFQINRENRIVPAIATRVKISPDQKKYTFTIRQSTWSNGDPLTAHDFEKTWKSLLHPQFPAPNANQFFIIKGAKAFKEGSGSEENVGIHAPNAETLIVELTKPTPYFLKLLTTYFFFPVHQTMRNSQNPLPAEEVVSNGPFKMDHWKHNNELAMKKNPHYWNASQIQQNAVILYVLDDYTAFQMFETGGIDWTGSPLGTLPQDLIASLKEQGRIHIAPVAATYWLRFNTEAAPFNNRKMRRAFNLALNRHDIVTHVTQGNQVPALGIVPPSLGLDASPYFEDNNVSQAWTLFEEALKETGTDREKLPPITLTYAVDDRMHKIVQALQQQWKNVFGIEVKLEGLEPKYFQEKVNQFNYQVSASNWFADFNDPINFLDIFKYRTNSSNKTLWEHPDYIKLLDASDHEMNPQRRKAILRQAEALLIDQMPVAPLFFGAYNYLKNNQVEGIFLSPLGLFEFHPSLGEKMSNTNWTED